MTKLITVWNLSYGLFQLFLAVTRHSYWYFTMAVYFFLLGLGRLLAVSQKLKHRTRIRILSAMIAFLSVVICGLTYLMIHHDIYPVMNKILVIAHAAFAFTLITAALYNVVISFRRDDPQKLMIRNLSLAAAIGSILSLERTMLGTFGEPGLEFNVRMEAYTGFATFIILLVIALNLFRAAGKED